MVLINLPPPNRYPNPLYSALEVGTRLRQIFDQSTSYEQQNSDTNLEPSYSLWPLMGPLYFIVILILGYMLIVSSGQSGSRNQGRGTGGGGGFPGIGDGGGCGGDGGGP